MEELGDRPVRRHNFGGRGGTFAAPGIQNQRLRDS